MRGAPAEEDDGTLRLLATSKTTLLPCGCLNAWRFSLVRWRAALACVGVGFVRGYKQLHQGGHIERFGQVSVRSKPLGLPPCWGIVVEGADDDAKSVETFTQGTDSCEAISDRHLNLHEGDSCMPAGDLGNCLIKSLGYADHTKDRVSVDKLPRDGAALRTWIDEDNPVG